MSTFTDNLDALLGGEGPDGEILQTAPTTDEWVQQHGVVFYYLNLFINGVLNNYMSPTTEPLKTWIEGDPWDSFEDMMAAGHVAMFP